MSKRATARYTAWPTDVLVYPKNADGSLPTPAKLLGGVGPFDYSGLTPAAVPMKIKIDSGAVESISLDLSGAVSTSAVTVAELFAAINTATPTDITASADVATGRIMIAHDTPSSVSYLQVYDDAATVAGFGYGKGARIAYVNTQQSLTASPTRKDDETISATDSTGNDTEIISKGYKKGSTGTLVDVADDWFLKSVIDGGTYDATAETYEAPNPDSTDSYFVLEYVVGEYGEGTNLENEIVGYKKTIIRNCSGYMGDETIDRNITIRTYNWTATNYKVSGVYVSDMGDSKLDASEYATADFSGVATY